MKLPNAKVVTFEYEQTIHRTNCIYKGMYYGTTLSPHNTKLYSVCIVEEHAALKCVDSSRT